GSSGSPPSAEPRSSGKLRPSPDDRRRRREGQVRERRIADLESRIAEREQAIKELETQMADTGFYGDRTAAEAVISRHQALMWEVGDLMGQWEALQTAGAND